MHVLRYKGIKIQSEIIKDYLSVLKGKQVDWYTECSYETYTSILKTKVSFKVCAFNCPLCSNWTVGGWIRINPNVVRIVKSAQNNGRSLISIREIIVIALTVSKRTDFIDRPAPVDGRNLGLSKKSFLLAMVNAIAVISRMLINVANRIIISQGIKKNYAFLE